MEAFMHFFDAIKDELLVVATAALPVIELKGAIPVGLAAGIDLWTSFFLAYMGSLLPVPILLFFLKSIMDFLRKTRILRSFAHWLDARTRKKGTKIKTRKYSLLGLFLFVAVPLPTTGVWSGSLIASFLNLRVLHAFPAIALGNLVAGLIVLYVAGYFV